ncbi:MAG: polysaccharide pyruvyl transferase family protein [Lachnospiraceae bacterium]|nr:polysaccharide pyruvyl transferase family protein [Lachnospiraceae bacterium]
MAKIVYVGDNRNRYNFGCRATSTALSQLISQDHEIVGRVYGHYKNDDTRRIFYVDLLPASVYKMLGRRKHWEWMKKWLVLTIHILKRTKVCFSRFDFIGYDFDKSIKNLIKCLPANPVLRELDLRQYDFDYLVVNGEGSFIFSTLPWREGMVEAMLMYWAKSMGKKVFYMNGMFSEKPGEELNTETINNYRPLFETIDFVGVREYRSLAFAEKYFPKARITLYPDALFTWHKYINDSLKITNGKYYIGFSQATDASFWEYDFSAPYICISGSSLYRGARNENDVIEHYVKLIDTIKKEISCNIYIVEACDGDECLREVGKQSDVFVLPKDTPILAAGKILANARVYITGRYHPAILASLGGTPCIFLSCNSHKNQSLQELLAYENPHEYNVLSSDKEINAILNEAKMLISQGESYRDRIKERIKILGDKAEEMRYVLKSE